MFHDRRVIAVIPARSGSKGLPDKNIRNLNGMPLLAHSILQARETGIMDEIFLSTDSREYAELAVKYGASVPFLRSRGLASDSASTWDCVREALGRYQALGKEYDIFVLLQPTSPLRTAEIFLAPCAMILDADSVVSVCEAEHSPLWAIHCRKKSLKNFSAGNHGPTRQELPVSTVLTGRLRSGISFFGSKKYHDGIHCLRHAERKIRDIDTLLDFAFAEYLLTRRTIRITPPPLSADSLAFLFPTRAPNTLVMQNRSVFRYIRAISLCSYASSYFSNRS